MPIDAHILLALAVGFAWVAVTQRVYGLPMEPHFAGGQVRAVDTAKTVILKLNASLIAGVLVGVAGRIAGWW